MYLTCLAITCTVIKTHINVVGHFLRFLDLVIHRYIYQHQRDGVVLLSERNVFNVRHNVLCWNKHLYQSYGAL